MKGANHLGNGAYGVVTRQNNFAVKSFGYQKDLVQEVSILNYLNDCKYIVKLRNFSLEEKKTYMELYNGDFRWWLNENDPSMEQINMVLSDVLCGMVELHDRMLVHGDIKPENILIRTNPFSAVLGDCGFVTVYKYCKTKNTTTKYRDPDHTPDFTHDIFSFGILLIDIYARIKIRLIDHEPLTYMKIKKSVDTIPKEHDRNIVMSLISENKHERPTARQIYHMLFDKEPPVGRKVPISIYRYDKDILNRRLMEKYEAIYTKFKINRNKLGYYALIDIFHNKNINDYNESLIYIVCMCYVMSSIYGNKSMEEKDVWYYLRDIASPKYVNVVISFILTNPKTLNILYNYNK